MMDEHEDYDASHDLECRDDVVLGEEENDDGYIFNDYDYDAELDGEEESEELDAPLWKYFPAGSDERELHR